MARHRARRKPLPTIWEVPDALWQRIEPILRGFWPRKATGRPPAPPRRTFDGVIFRMRTGCQWSELPAKYGPKSTVHDWFQRWAAGGVLEQIWALLVAECEELGGVAWKWQAADGMLGKARSGGGKDGPEPHRPRETGHQEALGDRRIWRPAGGRDRRGQRAGLQAAGIDDRGRRGRASRS